MLCGTPTAAGRASVSSVFVAYRAQFIVLGCSPKPQSCPSIDNKYSLSRGLRGCINIRVEATSTSALTASLVTVTTWQQGGMRKVEE